MQDFNQYFAIADQLKNNFQPPLTTPIMAVAGPFNSGKSTLINNLIGQQLSPVGVIPTTPTCICFSHGEKFSIKMQNHNRQPQNITQYQLAQMVTGREYKSAQVQKIAVQLPHPLLQKITIVDTPGVDALGVDATRQTALDKELQKAHFIVYLLHQKGVSDADRPVIQNIIQHKSLSDIFFVINKNLSTWDGSSLDTARELLREICHGPAEVLALNTKSSEDVDKLSLLLQKKAVALLIKEARPILRKLDSTIPALVNQAAQKNKDIDFIISYGQARAVSQQILKSYTLMRALPPITASAKALFAQEKTKIHNAGHTTLVYKTADPVPDPTVIKDQIKKLLQTVLQGNLLTPYPPLLTGWHQIKRQLNQEQYLAVLAGGFSSGKTTFINALLGEPLLPMENRPTTTAITYLKSGTSKKAVVNYAREILIPTHRPENNQALVCNHELATLEFWLKHKDLRQQIIKITKNKGGRFYHITARQLLQELTQLKSSLAKHQPRPEANRNSWPTIFKKLSRRQFDQTSPATYYQVYFSRQKQQALNLDNPADVRNLRQLIGSPLGLPVDSIVIQHGAPMLRLATLVDTPGLDAVYRKHDALTRQYLSQADCLLFFCNGKHILTRPDQELWQHFLNKVAPNQDLEQKLFLVVNFADTLSGAEQEKVRLYLNRHIVKPSRGGISMQRIYFISSLQALQGQYSGEFSRLKRHLKNHIWHSRCQHNYLYYLDQCRDILTSLPAASQGDTSATGQQIDLYLHNIDQLKRGIGPTGGMHSGKRPDIR